MSHSHHTHRQKESRHEPNKCNVVVTTDRLSQPSTDHLFSIDRKGDVQNLRFGSTDKYKVPKYRTAGYGRLLGLDRSFKVVSTTSSEREIDNVAIDWGNRNKSSRLHLKDQVYEDEKPVQASVVDRDDFSEQQNYVRLGRKRRRLSHSEKSDSHSSARALFNTSKDNPSDSDSETSSSSAHEGESKNVQDEDAFQKFKNHSDNKKNVDLRKRTSENPHDATVWLELINHQERYYMLSIGEGKPKLNASQRRAVTDMRVSLYETAIASVKDKQAREKLILGLMKEGSKLWDVGRQIKEWKRVLHHAQSLELWYEYLNFQQTNPIVFAYEKCLETYIEVWGTLSSELEEQNGDIDYHRTYFVLRLTRFMFDAGFTERAIAVWQTLLEYNFFKPATKDASLAAFGEFWESEYTRIGEDGAKGWCFDVEQEVSMHNDRPLEEIDQKAGFADWVGDEARRSIDDIMPARILDNTTEDDPFRVIVFADIKDFIFRVSSRESEHNLIQAFLKFCSLPPMYNTTEPSRSWWKDAYLCDFNPELLPGRLTDTSTLFAPPGSALHQWDTTISKSRGILDFAVRVLIQFAERADSSDSLVEYTIGLQLQKDPKSARKWAKGMLKRRPNSLLLYNAYALVEQRGGKAEVSDNVWSTALAMSSSLGQQAYRDRILLWHSWIWELMSQQRYSFVRSLVTMVLPADKITTQSFQDATASQDTSAGQRLRADAYLREQISEAIGRDGDHVVEFTGMYAILQYLNHNNDITEALSVYQSTMSLLKQERFSHPLERLHQSRARFVHLHASLSNSGYRPMQMVNVLHESMKAFPDNPLFITLHEKYLRSAGVFDRLRVAEIGVENGNDVTVSYLQTIAKELSRPLYSGSTSHDVRHAFIKATAIESPARYLPGMWMVWIQWEWSMTSDQPAASAKRAKDVYLSAIRTCPWYKGLYLVAFSEKLLCQELGDRELTQVYRSMIERGLRIRHDITEVLDGVERDGKA